MRAYTVVSADMRNRGFTLIELTIALVIIAMLAAGVLAGRALIQQTTVISTVRQMIEIKQAAVDFKNIYDAVPGDFSTATRIWGTTWPTGATNGNGDGFIDSLNAASVQEHHEFFRHLGLAKLISGNYCGQFCEAYGNTLPWHPPTQVNNGSFNAVAARGMYYGAPDTNQIRVARLLTAAPWWDGIFTPREALSADIKFDDGIPSKGKIIGVAGNAQPWINCTSTDPYGAVSTGAYSTNVDTPTCMIILQFDDGVRDD